MKIYIQFDDSSVYLNRLGKQLLEASELGNDEEVRSLLSQGAPFIADLVRQLC